MWLRILIFHGYLLRGTGSNVYNASLVRRLVALGHEVDLFCQDRDAADLGFVDAVGRWRGGVLRVETVRRPVRCTAYLPDIGGLLPVYVRDRYEGFEAKPYPELTDGEIERYIAANVAAVRDVIALRAPGVAVANHLVMGPVILARALAGRIPYAVKIHGSALEYTVRADPERFGPYAREGLQGAAGVLVGSRHTAESLWEVVGLPGLPGRTRLLTPGVDVRSFRPRTREEARAGLRTLVERLADGPASWGGDIGAPEALGAVDPARDRIVTYVGKLMVAKGVDLLIAAWPLVVSRVPDARLLVVGFGGYRDGLLGLVRALGAGDLTAARTIASRGRELEGGPPGELRYLTTFLDRLGEAQQNEAERGRTRQNEAERGRTRQNGMWLPLPMPCAGCTSPAGSNTIFSPHCCPCPKHRPCRARFRRRSAWSPPRRRAADRSPSPPGTPAWPRWRRYSRPRWRRTCVPC